MQRAALQLFTKQGYDRTTTEEIARAADVSLGTLFNYFPSKEALVGDEYDPLFIQLLESRPPDEPIFTAIRQALEAMLRSILAEEDRGFLMARAKLTLEVPALRAASLLERESSARLLQELLAKRSKRKAHDFELKVTSAILVSAISAALESWTESGGKTDLMKLVGRALEVAEQGARFESSPPSKARR
ncbi:TetR/AcrR family transcriptional regulator [Citreicoccus inhibens]|uniref:TetR/AcrR family transcriptional regulator n=1 Tax=Citreicoccus inhibens TaxID=2849499 RepID=UPI002E2CA5B8|nr:TetR family transcriptional regulator [Citreicoccus inhibens]